jgi:hypothetical protein
MALANCAFATPTLPQNPMLNGVELSQNLVVIYQLWLLGRMWGKDSSCPYRQGCLVKYPDADAMLALSE